VWDSEEESLAPNTSVGVVEKSPTRLPVTALFSISLPLPLSPSLKGVVLTDFQSLVDCQ